MAYTDTKMEEIIYGATSAGGPLTTPGDIAWWGSLNQAFRVRRLAVMISTGLTVTSAILSFDLQPTSGSATGRIPAWAGTMTIPVALGVQGSVFCTPELNLELTAGARLVVALTQGATAGAGMIGVYGDYRWDTIVNNPRITQLAS